MNKLIVSKVLSFVFLMCLSTHLFAQTTPSYTYTPTPPSPKTNGPSNKWYISLHVGSGMAFGDDSYNVFHEFKEASGSNVSFTVGYDFSRLFGLRWQTNLMHMYNRVNLEIYDYYLGTHPEWVPNKGFYGYHVLQSSAEVTLNVSNLLLPSRPVDSHWNWSVFLGPGVTSVSNYDTIVQKWKKQVTGYNVNFDNHVQWNVNMGTALEYRFNPNFGINAEVMCSFTGDRLEGVKSEEFYDAIVTYSLGLTYHF